MNTDNTLTTWSDAWLDALAGFSHPGRMRRGRRFAELKNIRRLDIQPGVIQAKVKDGRNTYDTEIRIDVFDDAAWDAIITRLASQAIYSARLLSGEIPPEVVNVFEDVGVSLFPEADALHASCNCPDWEVPCKHIAGLYYILADKFEDDPFLLFLLRGRNKDELLSSLRHRRQTPTDAGLESEPRIYKSPPLTESLSHFWDIGPSMQSVIFNIAEPKTNAPHLKRLGQAPFTHLDLVTILSPIYDTVTETALQWAFEDIGNKS